MNTSTRARPRSSHRLPAAALAALLVASSACGPAPTLSRPPGEPQQSESGPTAGAPATGPLFNGDFEEGTLAGWTVIGAASISDREHTGAYAALVGGPLEESVNSIAQTFLLPSDASLLSFWYEPDCTGTVMGGSASATLAVAGGPPMTLLAPVCDTGLGWQPVEINVAAYAGKAVTLQLSTDNEGATAPVSTLFDDVAVSRESLPPPPVCEQSSDCPVGDSCQAGSCIGASSASSSCSTDNDCPSDETCQAGLCALPTQSSCTSDADCGGGQICQGWACVDPSPAGSACTVDSDCGAGSCAGGTCSSLPPGCTAGDPSCDPSVGASCDPSDPSCGGGDPGTDPGSTDPGSTDPGGDDPGDGCDDCRVHHRKPQAQAWRGPQSVAQASR